ncbi:hypothetical protein MUY27_11160 [Mucilaginibacter sp. RS28]|uniref:Transmembrane protein n=1 Tax=Mucilaginibacter straminoryzae TaxID=2932774 RepID=A0A9X1X2X0_9SPHI|nr:hypothetical protein [Mucilaginibacter straminoryzae]MCJ8210267.1 hypothetical protein [Mucilaginibacter straminoryzae]
MNKLTDEELQKMLEEGLNQPMDDHEDLMVYSQLFNELKKEPNEGLRMGLSSRVAARLELKQDLQLSLKNYLIGFVAVVAFMAIAGLVALVFTKSQDGSSTLQLFDRYKWYGLLSAVLLMAFHYIDQRIKLSKFKV